MLVWCILVLAMNHNYNMMHYFCPTPLGLTMSSNINNMMTIICKSISWIFNLYDIILIILLVQLKPRLRDRTKPGDKQTLPSNRCCRLHNQTDFTMMRICVVPWGVFSLYGFVNCWNKTPNTFRLRLWGHPMSDCMPLTEQRRELFVILTRVV